MQGGIKRDKKCMFRDTRRDKERQGMHVPWYKEGTEHAFLVSLYPSLYHGRCIHCLSLSLLVSRNMHSLSLFIPPCITEHAFIVSLYPSLYHGTCISCKRDKKCMFHDTRRDKERQEMHVPWYKEGKKETRNVCSVIQGGIKRDTVYHGTCIPCLSLSLLVSRNMYFLSLFIPPCITERQGMHIPWYKEG
jgi:hypothetical protein